MKRHISALLFLSTVTTSLYYAYTVAAQPLQRIPNSTLTMPTVPPTMGYASTNAFGTLTFVNPIAIVSPPGETNRVFIIEKNGTIQVTGLNFLVHLEC